jgi:antitoxin PrlF
MSEEQELAMVASEARRPRATVRAKAQLTLPPEIRAALRVREGDEVEFTITEAGDVLLRGMTSMPTDQRWFWEPEWQAGEREASEQIMAGDVEIFDDAEAMFASLDT